MDVNELLNTVELKSQKKPEKNQAPSPAPAPDKSFDNVMDSISQNWDQKPNKEIEELKKKLSSAQLELERLKNEKGSFTKNEEKILAAIRSESLNQNTNEPQISSRIFRTTYKVSSDYFRKSIDSLIDCGVIQRSETKYAGKIPTYRWKIVGDSTPLPHQ